MIPLIRDGEATTQLRAQIPTEKWESKRRSTLLGALLFGVGTVLMLIGTVLPFRMDTFDKWMLVPFAGGFVFAFLGGHIMSGEVMIAMLKDAVSAIPWPGRNGDAAP